MDDLSDKREPGIGSIVWYASEEQREPCAAIVVGKDLAWQWDDAGPKVDLLVITEDGAFRWARGVDRGAQAGEWRWPE